MSKRFDRISRLFKGEGYGQDPDAAQDIDVKLNKKRRTGNNVPAGVPDYTGQSASLASNTTSPAPAKKDEGFGCFFKR